MVVRISLSVVLYDPIYSVNWQTEQWSSDTITALRETLLYEGDKDVTIFWKKLLSKYVFSQYTKIRDFLRHLQRTKSLKKKINEKKNRFFIID